MAANRVGKTWGAGGYETALHLTIDDIERRRRAISGFSVGVHGLARGEPHYSIFIHCDKDDCFHGSGDTLSAAIEQARDEYVASNPPYTKDQLDATLGIERRGE